VIPPDTRSDWPSWAQRAWQNECAGWSALGRAAGADGVFHVEHRGPLICAWWRGPGTLESYLLVEPRAAEAPEVLDSVAGALQEHATSSIVLRLVTDTAQLAAWQEAAAAHGFVFAGADLLMACPLEAARAPQARPSEISVLPVAGAQEHHTALQIVREVYGDPPGMTEFFNPLGAVRMYLGLWAGEPAASATLWPFAGIAGVYSVATRPWFRHRGLATAVVDALLYDAAQAGFELATLRTEQSLIPLYGRLGFRAVGQVYRFRRRPQLVPW
jgi:ribosomal protein S18 acetylase RimI-like enzyme